MNIDKAKSLFEESGWSFNGEMNIFTLSEDKPEDVPEYQFVNKQYSYLKVLFCFIDGKTLDLGSGIYFNTIEEYIIDSELAKQDWIDRHTKEELALEEQR